MTGNSSATGPGGAVPCSACEWVSRAEVRPAEDVLAGLAQSRRLSLDWSARDAASS
jgi:hypothetical protein